MIKESIIKSLLDNDLYTFGVGQLVHSEFPDAVVSYTFINRSRTKFPSNFVEELKNQLDLLSRIQFDDTELNWLFYLPFMVNKSYARFLATYTFDPNELEITNEDGNLVIKINGKWARTIMWEVPLLALISELYYRLTGASIDENWAERIVTKGNALEEAGCVWMDFGTRRRYSLSVQNAVVATMSKNKGFVGTSNCYLAYLYNVKPIGTMSHQFIMGISGIFGVKNANSVALRLWKEFYGNDLSIFLPDTFTTESFLQGFNAELANGYEGLRQDSGDPHDWMDNKVIPHYEKIGVSLKDKRIIFSDSLNVYLAIELFEEYKDVAKISFGIGTNFSNEVGIKPLNIVVKLTQVNGVDVVKLSDNIGKYTGNQDAIQRAKQELGLL
jgi:nicotinate phosphoribosyltransferase